MLYGCSPELQGNLPKSRVELDVEKRFIVNPGVAIGRRDAATIGFVMPSVVILVGILSSFVMIL